MWYLYITAILALLICFLDGYTDADLHFATILLMALFWPFYILSLLGKLVRKLRG